MKTTQRITTIIGLMALALGVTWTVFAAVNAPTSVTPRAIVPAVPLPSPTNLVATVQDFSIVSLTWTPLATNETGYRVEKAVDTNSTWVEIQTLTGHVSSCVVASTNAAACLYRVRTYNSSDSPTNSVTFTKTSNVYIQWIDNSDTEWSYRLKRRKSTQSYWTDIAGLAPNTVAYIDPNLGAGTYYYFVRAIEYSAYSNIADPRLNAPTNLTADGVSTNTIYLTWKYDIGTRFGFTIERAQCSLTNGTYVLNENWVDIMDAYFVSANEGSGEPSPYNYYFYDSDGLQPNTRYCYRLMAILVDPSTVNTNDPNNATATPMLASSTIEGFGLTRK